MENGPFVEQSVNKHRYLNHMGGLRHHSIPLTSVARRAVCIFSKFFGIAATVSFTGFFARNKSKPLFGTNHTPAVQSKFPRRIFITSKSESDTIRRFTGAPTTGWSNIRILGTYNRQHYKVLPASIAAMNLSKV